MSNERQSRSQDRAADGNALCAIQHRSIIHLVDAHAGQLAPSDTRWLLGIAADARRGRPLSADRLARISAIRARLAREYHRG